MTALKIKTVQKQSLIQILAMVLIGAGLVVLGIVAWILLPRPQTSNQAAAVSENLTLPAKVSFAAPELSLHDLEGKPVSLAAYRGQVVLINNWATWCPPCKAEMPALQAYFDAHRAQNFTLVGIEAGEPVEQVADFVQQNRLTFPIWPDVDQTALDAFRNDNLPSSYVIDKTGQVRLTWVGAASREMLEKYVTPLLEE